MRSTPKRKDFMNLNAIPFRDVSYCTLLIVGLACSLPLAQEAVKVSGELKLWHPVTLTLTGPATSESADPNPFFHYRLEVTFTQGAERIVVPGYYAADGNAAETSADTGDKWQVKFTPHLMGEWIYTVSFKQGNKIAVADDDSGGTSVAPDGATGTFIVGPTDKTGPDHRFHGMLKYVGEHYAQYQGSKKYFINAGSRSPENFLAYFEFDNTEDLDGKGFDVGSDNLHHYEPHIRDWREGDPTWQGGKGKGIIGALNYLASEGMNTFYAITWNVEGDGKDTWPWTGPQAHDRYDVSKLAQWEIVFSHMDVLGLQLEMCTQEEGEEQLLGKMTPERKLYYRELIARFSHHHAIIWDLGEDLDRNEFYENVQDIKNICEYFKKIDPFDHPIQYTQFYYGEFLESLSMDYGRLLGYGKFDGTGLQMSASDNTFYFTKKWVDSSAKADHKWLVGALQTNPNSIGVVPDDNDFWHDKERKHVLWGNLMAGGSGSVFFFGYKYPNHNINLEDFRSRDHFWDLVRYAHQFFMNYLPFHRMKNDNDLTPGDEDYVYAKKGDIYAIYLREGGSPKLNLTGAPGNFFVKWYDPRNGGELQDGDVKQVSGGSEQSLGSPPKDADKDWAVLVRRVASVKGMPSADKTGSKLQMRIASPGEAGYNAAGQYVPAGPQTAVPLWVPLPASPANPGK